MREALHYTLTLPVSTVIVGCDTIAQLEQNVALTRDFRPLDRAQMAAIEARTRDVSRQAQFYKFFDRA